MSEYDRKGDGGRVAGDSRQEAESSQHPLGQIHPNPQIAAKIWRKHLQRKAAQKGERAAGADAQEKLASADGSSGSQLPSGLRQKFEGALGADLTGVRVHTGSESAAAAESVSARAYTVGSDIHFGAGQFDPSSREGERLIAHEVAHTVQGKATPASVQPKLEVSQPGDAAEVEADRIADSLVDNHPVAPPSATAQGISRDPTQPTFQSAAVKEVYDSEGSQATPAQLSGLRWLDGPDQGAWTKVSWAEVQKGAAERIYHPEKIDQVKLGVCAAAAVANALATRPLEWAMEIRTCFRNGTFGGKKANSGLLKHDPRSDMAQVDWMLLSAMQDANNDFLSYNGEPGGLDEGAGAGGQKFYLEKALRCVKTEDFDADGIVGSNRASNLLRNHPNETFVLIRVHANQLPGQSDDGKGDRHCMRLLQPIVFGEQPSITVFTWASNQTFTFHNWEHYKRCVFGFVVGTTNAEISL
jgi:hypothetical protein